MSNGGPFPLGGSKLCGVVLLLGIQGAENGGSGGKVGSEKLADAPMLEDGFVRGGTCTGGGEIETVMGRGWVGGVDGIWNGGGFRGRCPFYGGVQRAI
jgi:hypothetical protein